MGRWMRGIWSRGGSLDGLFLGLRGPGEVSRESG